MVQQQTTNPLINERLQCAHQLYSNIGYPYILNYFALCTIQLLISIANMVPSLEEFCLLQLSLANVDQALLPHIPLLQLPIVHNLRLCRFSFHDDFIVIDVPSGFQAAIPLAYGIGYCFQFPTCSLLVYGDYCTYDQTVQEVSSIDLFYDFNAIVDPLLFFATFVLLPPPSSYCIVCSYELSEVVCSFSVHPSGNILFQRNVDSVYDMLQFALYADEVDFH